MCIWEGWAWSEWPCLTQEKEMVQFDTGTILVVGQVTIQQIHSIFIGSITLNVLILLHVLLMIDVISLVTVHSQRSKAFFWSRPEKETIVRQLKFVLNFCHNDFNESSLQWHLQLLGTSIQSNGSNPILFDMIDFLRSVSMAHRTVMSEPNLL